VSKKPEFVGKIAVFSEFIWRNVVKWETASAMNLISELSRFQFVVRQVVDFNQVALMFNRFVRRLGDGDDDENEFLARVVLVVNIAGAAPDYEPNLESVLDCFWAVARRMDEFSYNVRVAIASFVCVLWDYFPLADTADGFDVLGSLFEFIQSSDNLELRKRFLQAVDSLVDDIELRIPVDERRAWAQIAEFVQSLSDQDEPLAEMAAALGRRLVACIDDESAAQEL
jgi:hypothetical protein